jgi:trafficking protein particle complex subunit 3
VATLVQEHPYEMQNVTKVLDKIGYAMGVRLIEDFFAKSNLSRCSMADFKDCMEMITKVSNVVVMP